MDIAFLVAFRIGFGVTMLYHVWHYFSSGEIKYFYVDPVFHFTYYGFDWVKPWPGAGMYLHFYTMGILATLILLGLHYRISMLLFSLAFTYQFLLDKALYQNHYYLICLISAIMVFLPAHRAFSLDALLRPSIRASTTPLWTLWLLRIQIGIPYFYGGIAKCNADWFLCEPMRLGMAERTNFPLLGRWFTDEWMVHLFTYGGLLLDLSVVPFLVWRRTRIVAYLFCLSFHLLNSRLFNIGLFPWFMIFATLIFFEPDWPKRCLRGLVGWFSWSKRALASVPPSPAPAQFISAGNRSTLVVLGVYLAVQMLVPLRHYVYPGDPSWTEQGHRFAWHMMLRGKSSAIRFMATDPQTGHTGAVNLRPYLTERQLTKLGKEPEMILHFSHFLRDEMARSGFPGVEIRALVLVSLNGRKPQLLIDPTVNLAAQPRRLFSFPDWIVPLREPLRTSPWQAPVTEWEKLVLPENQPGGAPQAELAAQ